MARARADLFGLSERLMGMDDAAWARHANPASVLSRFTVMPLLTLALWSRDWLGWYCLAPLALTFLWIWWNPRAFPPPRHTQSWAAHGTFGERIFLRRHRLNLPAHHLVWARSLTGLSAIGLVPWLWGLWLLDLTTTLLGLTFIVGAKAWFVDRMVWLYQDMKAFDPAFAAWDRPAASSGG